MTQCEMVLKYIEDFGSITPMQAFADLGITKLATRVSEMRRDGVSFKIEMEKGRNRYGKPTRYAKYSFPEVRCDNG